MPKSFLLKRRSLNGLGNSTVKSDILEKGLFKFNGYFLLLKTSVFARSLYVAVSMFAFSVYF